VITTAIQASDVLEALDNIQAQEGSAEEILGLMIKRRIRQFIADKYPGLGGAERSLKDLLIGQPRSSCRILLDEPEARYIATEIGGFVYRNTYTASVADCASEAARRLLEPTGLLELFDALRIEVYGAHDGKVKISTC
jgi:hypothetical protein